MSEISERIRAYVNDPNGLYAELKKKYTEGVNERSRS